MRAPVAPIGWPSAIAPPLTLSRSVGDRQPRSAPPAPAPRTLRSARRDRSRRATRPVRSRSFWIAGTGPMPIDARIDAGARPAEDLRASGFRPRRPRRARADASTSAAPPSVMPDEAPAVMMPGCPSTSSNTSGSLPGSRSSCPPRGCSSAIERSTGWRLCASWTRHRRDLAREMPGVDRRLRLALALEREGDPTASRVMPYWRASISAVSPMIRFDTGHVEAVAVHRVDQREVAHPVAPARVDRVDQVRHPAHRLDAAGEHDVRLAQHDRLRAGGDRLQAGGAGLVDRLRRRRVGDAGAVPTCRAGFGPEPAWRPWPISTSSTSDGGDAGALDRGARGDARRAPPGGRL